MTNFATKYRNAPLRLLQAKFEALTTDARLLVGLYNAKRLTALDVLRTKFEAVTTYALYSQVQALGLDPDQAAIKDVINKFSPNVCAEKNFLEDEIRRRALL
jgi:hypothetical protein